MTDVSKADLSRVYLFLQEKGGIIAADGYNATGAQDRIVVLSEFRNFMENEFDWNGVSSSQKDLIDGFWNNFDTNQSGKVFGISNKNALDDKEMAAVGKKVQYYDVMMNFFKAQKNDLFPKGVISTSYQTKFEDSIKNSLAATTEEYMEHNGDINGLEEVLAQALPMAKAKATADYCAIEMMDKSFNNLKDFYKASDDRTLNDIIDRFVSEIDPNLSAQDIKSKVTEIIDAYKKTAETGEVSQLLKNYGYDPLPNDRLNDLQKAMLKHDITVELERDQGFKDAIQLLGKDLINTQLDNYVNTIAVENYAKIKPNVVNEFKASDAYKKIQDGVNLYNYVKDDTKNYDESELKKQLTENISAGFAAKFGDKLSNPKFDELLKETVNVAIGDDKPFGDPIDTSKAVAYLVSLIAMNIGSFYSKAEKEAMELSELYTIYDNVTKNTPSDKKEDTYRAMAKFYTEVAGLKGSAYQKVVDDVVNGRDIQTMTSKEIEDMIKDLRVALDNMVDPNNCKFELNTTSISITTGETKEFDIGAKVTKDGNLVTKDVKFEVTSNNGSAYIDESGKLHVTAPNVDGKYDIQVQATINGQPVGEAKTITVNVQKQDIMNGILNSSAASEDMKLSETVDNWNDYCNDDESFKSLYMSDSVVILYGKKDSNKHNWGKNGQNDCRTGLQNLGKGVINVLKTNGFDEILLNQALNNVINNMLVDPQGDSYYKYSSGNKGGFWGTVAGLFTGLPVTGAIVGTALSNGSSKEDLVNNAIYVANNNRESTAHTIIQVKDTEGSTDSNCYAIHFKDFVDDIIAEYNRLAGN